MRFNTRNPDGRNTHNPYRAFALLLFGVPLVIACGDKGGFITEDEYEDRLTWGDDDGDGHYDEDDCDDGDASIHPDATEVCDGVDNDCDGEVDEGVTTPWYADADGDGYGSDVSVDGCGDPGDDFVPISGDCDDDDASIHPGAEEVCDEVDNDCDGSAETEEFNADSDGDGYGDPSNTLTSEECGSEPPDGYTRDGSDCDDTDEYTYPGAPEVCDGIVNDCDDDTSEPDEGLTNWFSFHDSDGDGEGDPLDSHYGCTTPTDYELEPFDCDDDDPAANSSSPSDDFIDSDGDSEYNCWDPSTYSFDASWGEGSAEDWLIDNGDGTYTPYNELSLCGYIDSPFSSADGDEGLGVWSIDSNDFIVEESNDACSAIGLEVGTTESISVDIEYTVNDSAGSGIWIAVPTTDGYLVSTYKYPYNASPEIAVWYFEDFTSTAIEFNSVNDSSFYAPDGVFSVTIMDDTLEATIGGATTTVDDGGNISSYALIIEPGDVYVGSWNNDDPLELEAITVSNPYGWSLGDGGTYTR